MQEPKFYAGNQVVAETEAMLQMEEEQLEEILAMRMNAIQENVDLSLQPTFEVQADALEAFTLPSWVQNSVDSIVNTAVRQTYQVLCSKEQDYAALRGQLISALGVGGSAAVLSLAMVLTTTLGLAAALATVVATIVIKKIGLPALLAGYATMCEELGKLMADE